MPLPDAALRDAMRGPVGTGRGFCTGFADGSWKNCHQMKKPTERIQTTSETQKLTRMCRK